MDTISRRSPAASGTAGRHQSTADTPMHFPKGCEMEMIAIWVDEVDRKHFVTIKDGAMHLPNGKCIDLSHYNHMCFKGKTPCSDLSPSILEIITPPSYDPHTARIILSRVVNDLKEQGVYLSFIDVPSDGRIAEGLAYEAKIQGLVNEFLLHNPGASSAQVRQSIIHEMTTHIAFQFGIDVNGVGGFQNPRVQRVFRNLHFLAPQIVAYLQPDACRVRFGMYRSWCTAKRAPQSPLPEEAFTDVAGYLSQIDRLYKNEGAVFYAGPFATPPMHDPSGDVFWWVRPRRPREEVAGNTEVNEYIEFRALASTTEVVRPQMLVDHLAWDAFEGANMPGISEEARQRCIVSCMCDSEVRAYFERIEGF